MESGLTVPGDVREATAFIMPVASKEMVAQVRIEMFGPHHEPVKIALSLASSLTSLFSISNSFSVLTMKITAPLLYCKDMHQPKMYVPFELINYQCEYFQFSSFATLNAKKNIL